MMCCPAIDMGMMHTVPVRLADRSYDVVVGAGILVGVGEIARRACPATSGRAALIYDTGVPTDTTDLAATSLERAGWQVVRIAFDPSEDAKTLASADRLLRGIADSRHERGDPIVALGGGITGDVAGFVAAIYRRGVPVIQCPTTLLAMVDASVGGKTGVNLAAGESGGGLLRKNMVGAFHQPTAVLADVSVLATLDAREFRCGLAECIKHAIISGPWGQPDLMDFTQAGLEAILSRQPDALLDLVARNIAVKAAIVGVDERESPGGPRATLNLGHTFGHAIETLPELHLDGIGEGLVRHGEAVSLGLMAAAHLAARLGTVTSDYPQRLAELLATAGLPTRVSGLPDNAVVIERMGYDKKSQGGVLRLVIPASGCQAMVIEAPDAALVAEAIDSIRG